MRKRLLSIVILIMIVCFATGCSTAGQFYKEGKKSFEKGEYESAAESFNKAIKANPNRAEYRIDYGMASIALGKYEEALSQFRTVYMNKDMSIIKENNKRAHRGMGIAYYFMQDYKKAVKEFEKALNINELQDLNVDILYYKGNSLRSMGSFKEAVDTYTELLKDDKNNAFAYAGRAFCYQSLAMYEKSLEDYDKAITLEPENFEWYFGKYNLLIDQSDEESAKTALTDAAKIKVNTDEGKFNLAKLHYYQGDYDKAIKELKESYSAGFGEADYYLGEIYRIQDDYSKAIEYYQRYIKSGKGLLSDVYNQIGVCLMKVQEYEKAVEFLNKGIKSKDLGSLQTLMRNEIIAYEKMNDYDMAKKKMKAYLKKYPEDKEAKREEEFINSRLIK